MHFPPTPSLPPGKNSCTGHNFTRPITFLNESHTCTVLGHTMLGMCGSNYCSVLFIFCGGISLMTNLLFLVLESANCNGGQHTGKQVAGRKGRPRSAKRKHPFSRSKPQNDLKWHVKRSTLNKAIYDHKEQKCITCKKKLELDAECGGANPRLVFHLIPYGLEDDAGKSATLEIEVEISRKTRMSMHSSTKIRLSVCVQEMKEGNLLAKHENIEQSIDVSRFFIPQFLTHECLKHSRCDQIEIQASAELILHSEHPHAPTDSK